MALSVTAQQLPIANLILNNPDIAGLFAAANESSGAAGGLNFDTVSPPGPIPPTDLSNVFMPGGTGGQPGATPTPDPTQALGLALSGVQAQQPQAPVFLPPSNVNTGGGITDASPLLQLLLRASGGGQPSLGQLISGR